MPLLFYEKNNAVKWQMGGDFAKNTQGLFGWVIESSIAYHIDFNLMSVLSQVFSVFSR